MQQHFSYLPISISCLLTFLVALPHPASTASLVQPTKIRNSTAQTSANPVCVHDSNWLGTHYGHSDCRGAVNNFIASEVQTHRRQAYEFLAPNAQPIHDLPVVKTPRRYTSGSKVPPYFISPLSLFGREPPLTIDKSIRCLLPRNSHDLLPFLPFRHTTISPTSPLLSCRCQQF